LISYSGATQYMVIYVKSALLLFCWIAACLCSEAFSHTDVLLLLPSDSDSSSSSESEGQKAMPRANKLQVHVIIVTVIFNPQKYVEQ